MSLKDALSEVPECLVYKTRLVLVVFALEDVWCDMRLVPKWKVLVGNAAVKMSFVKYKQALHLVWQYFCLGETWT